MASGRLAHQLVEGEGLPAAKRRKVASGIEKPRGVAAQFRQTDVSDVQEVVCAFHCVCVCVCVSLCVCVWCVCVCVCVVWVTEYTPYIHRTSYLIIMMLVVTDHNDLFLQLSRIFEGKEFCVVNGSRAFSKDTMEKKIAEVCVHML